MNDPCKPSSDADLPPDHPISIHRAALRRGDVRSLDTLRDQCERRAQALQDAGLTEERLARTKRIAEEGMRMAAHKPCLRHEWLLDYDAGDLFPERPPWSAHCTRCGARSQVAAKVRPDEDALPAPMLLEDAPWTPPLRVMLTAGICFNIVLALVQVWNILR